MEHPLAMDAEAMRRAGYATVDALVDRLADPGAEPGRLLRLTSDDLQWLVDTQPAVKARIEATGAERLQNR